MILQSMTPLLALPKQSFFMESFKVANCDLKYYLHGIISVLKGCHQDFGASD